MELSAALSALSQGFTVIKGAIAARDDAKVTAALIDMSERLMNAYSAGLDAAANAGSLQSQLSAAQAEIAQLRGRLEERDAYVLHEIRPGAFTYTWKGVAGGGQPAHHLCQPCFDDGRKVVLQGNLDGDRLRCTLHQAHNITLRRSSINW